MTYLKRVIDITIQAFKSKAGREYFAYNAAEKLCSFIYPKYLFSEYGRIWLEDKDFIKWYKKTAENNHSADRKYFLKNLIKAVLHLKGDAAECGIYKGETSFLMCEALKNTNKTLYLFDSFEGLSEPIKEDGTYWQKGNFANTSTNYVEKYLNNFSNYRIMKGWIPERFAEIAEKTFCFTHIDVDLLQPTLNSLAFFYPRTVAGGIIIFDDYGFASCPGARKVIDNFFEGCPEKIIQTTTGQAFVIKI